MTRLYRIPLLIAATLSVIFVTAGRGMAVQQGSMSVSRTATTQSKDYGPFVTTNPGLTHFPSDCRTQSYCDEIDLHVDASKFASNDSYQVLFTVTYDNTVSALGLYIYDKTNTRVAGSSTGLSPTKTSVDHPYTGVYYIVIDNEQGPSTTYNLKVQLQYNGKLKSIPKFQGGPTQPKFTPLPPIGTPAAADAPQTPAPQNLSPAATLAPVLTPGADGPAGSFALDSVPTKAITTKNGLAWWAVLLIALVAAGIVGLLGYFGYRRVRRA